MDEEFDTPIPINLNGDISGYINSPSLTQDLNELYIYNQTNDTRQILIFNKENDNNYVVADTLPIPEGYIANPGKLCQNDFKYYLGLKNETDDSYFLHFFERESTDSNFESVYYLDNEQINISQFLISNHIFQIMAISLSLLDPRKIPGSIMIYIFHNVPS